jgi:hypothetical protein
MSHFIGQPYRYVSGLKNGSPVYEETIVVQAHDDHLILSGRRTIAISKNILGCATLTAMVNDSR